MMINTASDNGETQDFFSRGKKWAYVIIINIFVLLAMEVTARIAAFVYYDFNSYYIFFGNESWKTEEGHSEKLDGYFKFPSNRKFIYGTPEPARINNHGFRGPDFDNLKNEITYRIISMGASSTFGYKNRDNGTYPSILQRLYQDRAPALNVEVINAGIPHSNSSNILAMLQNELLSYDPDLLTLYTGYNDAAFPLAENTFQRVQRWLDTYSALYASLRKGAHAISIRLHERWQKYAPQLGRADIERQLELNLTRNRSNIIAIIETAHKNQIPLILIKQVVTTPAGISNRANTLGYEQEYQMIADKLKLEGQILGEDMAMYVHHELMVQLEILAQKYDLPLVDNIRLVDIEPEGLVTQVHLSEGANTRLAEELYKVIHPIILTH